VDLNSSQVTEIGGEEKNDFEKIFELEDALDSNDIFIN
jgi:hypothetical protein